jgi:hypothetical protein
VRVILDSKDLASYGRLLARWIAERPLSKSETDFTLGMWVLKIEEENKFTSAEPFMPDEAQR